MGIKRTLQKVCEKCPSHVNILTSDTTSIENKENDLKQRLQCVEFFLLQLQIHSIPNTNKTHPLKVNGIHKNDMLLMSSQLENTSLWVLRRCCVKPNSRIHRGSRAVLELDPHQPIPPTALTPACVPCRI